MGYYYKYNFVSPEPIYAIIREEFKSYMDTGAIDELMFPTYLNKALNKLGKSSYPIRQEILYIEDFQARLPDNFYGVREAWLCTEISGYPYQTANSFYSQAASASTIQVSPMIIDGVLCNDTVCPPGDCDPCMPNLVQAIYKTNNEVMRTFRREYLLKPGNLSARAECDIDYTSTWDMYGQPMTIHQSLPFSSSYDSFDIRGNKFVTNFREGVVHLLFYATDYDDGSNQLVPDNFRIREYVELFIKQKLIETLTNQVNDETFNQLQQKLVYYETKVNEAYVLAEVEIKKQTVWEKQRNIRRDRNRNNMYELPNRISRYGLRRNT